MLFASQSSDSRRTMAMRKAQVAESAEMVLKGMIPRAETPLALVP